MECFGAVRAVRLREVEFELMQLESKVWQDLNQEQQVLVNTEQDKLDSLTEAVLQARSSYNTELRRLCAVVGSSKSENGAGHTEAQTTSQSQQTEEGAIFKDAMSREEVMLLEKEVRALEQTVWLQREHKRLGKEPREGESFFRVRADLCAEEDANRELQIKIAGLEKAVNEAETRETGLGAGPPVPEHLDWTTAPWDDEPSSVPTGVPSPWPSQAEDSKPGSPLLSVPPPSLLQGAAGALPTPPRGVRPPCRFVPKKAVLFKKH